MPFLARVIYEPVQAVFYRFFYKDWWGKNCRKVVIFRPLWGLGCDFLNCYNKFKNAHRVGQFGVLLQKHAIKATIVTISVENQALLQ